MITVRATKKYASSPPSDFSSLPYPLEKNIKHLKHIKNYVMIFYNFEFQENH